MTRAQPWSVCITYTGLLAVYLLPYFLTATTPSRLSLLRVKAGYGWICLLFKAGVTWILDLFLMYFSSLPGGL